MNQSEPTPYDPIDMVIGNNLRQLRTREWEESQTNAAKLSQADVAFLLALFTETNWVQQTVSLAEKGERPFRVVDLFAISAIFRVSLIRLLQPYKPTARAIGIGALTLSPAEILDTFVLDPRPGDPAAKRWRSTDGWPETSEGAIKESATLARDTLETRDILEVDMDIRGFLEKLGSLIERYGLDHVEQVFNLPPMEDVDGDD